MRSQNIQFPPPLAPGDKIRIISPASPVAKDDLDRGAARLREWGYQVDMAPRALVQKGYLAGSDEERGEDLVNALLDPEIKGIICSRGGYGSLRLLARMPWSELEKAPSKAFVGFSDVSGWQLAWWERCRRVSLAGPQAAKGMGGNLTERSARHLRGMLDGQWRRLAWPGESDYQLHSVRPQAVEGVLLPCCLAILTSLIGTPYQPNLSGALLVLEDIEEPPYRLDRMIWQLVSAGLLTNIKGIILGSFVYKGQDLSAEVAQIILDMIPGQDFGLWTGLPFGHIPDRMTLPMGITAAVDYKGTIRLTGSNL